MGLFKSKKNRIQLNPKLIKTFNKVRHFTISPDGSTIAWTESDNPAILVGNLESEETRQLILPKNGGGSYKSLKKYPYYCDSICYSTDGSVLISILGSRNTNNFECAVWETSTWQLRNRIPLGEISAGRIALSPQKDWLAMGGYPEIYLVDLKTAEVKTLEGHGQSLVPSPLYNHVTFVAFHPDGKTLYSAADDGKVIYWDLSKDTQDTCGEVLGKHEYAIDCGCLSPDGKFLATSNLFNFKGRGGSIIIWDVNRKRMGHKFKKGAEALSFASDTGLISCCDRFDKNDNPVAVVVSLLDAEKGKLLESKEIKTSFFEISLSHTGRYLIGEVLDEGLQISQLF